MHELDVDLLKPLLENPDIQNDQTKYKASKLALLLSLETDEVYKIFSLIDYTKGNTDNWKISPYNFVKLVLDNVNNDILKSQLDSKMISSLNLVKTVMDSTIQNKVYTYSELASILNVSLDSIKSIYSLYDLTNNKLTMTPKQVVDFILKNSQNDLLKGKINKQTLNELTTLKEVMNGIINNKTYSYKEIASLFNMNKQDLKLLYSYYELNKNSYNINMSLKELINFILDDVITDSKYKSLFSLDSLDKLKILRQIIYDLENHKEYTSLEFKNVINKLDGSINQDTVDLLYLYYGSVYDYQNNYTLTIEKLINYLNDDILNDSKYQEFIDQEFKDKIKDAKKTIKEAKDNLVGSKYSRAIINTKLDAESNETFKFIKDVKKMIKNKDVYFVGDSLMAYEMNDTFDGELNFITILTMISIFMVVALTFKSISIPTILVLIIQTAVFVTMGVLTLLGGSVYFIALLIVQSILMGATIDYAIVFTAYYEEVRKDYEQMEAVILAYNKSIPTILTSSSILIVATFTVGVFAQDIASKICITLCQGTICSVILIIFLLPSILVLLDKLIIKKN